MLPGDRAAPIPTTFRTARAIGDRLLTRPYMRRRASQFARECDAEIVVGQDLVVGLHGRVLYLCGRCGNQCMTADAFRHLVKLRALAG
jgi:hypothetical protein